MPPQESFDPTQDANPELEALTELTMQANESLGGIEATNESSAIKLEEIEQNQEALIVQGERNTERLVEPLNQIAENTKQVGERLTESAEPISKMAAFLSSMKGEKGDKGDTPSATELTKLIKPLIPPPIKGDKGDSIKGDKGDKGDTPEIDYEKVAKKAVKLIPKPKDGKDGRDGKDGIGKPGKDGKSVDVEAVVKSITEKSSKLIDDEFETVRRIVSSKTYSMAELSDTQTATTGQIMVKQSDGSWAPGTGGGGGLTQMTPSESPDGVETAFTFSSPPVLVLTEFGMFFEDAVYGFTLVGNVATLPIPPSNFVRGYV